MAYRVIAEFVHSGQRITVADADACDWQPPTEAIAERLLAAGCLRRVMEDLPPALADLSETDVEQMSMRRKRR